MAEALANQFGLAVPRQIGHMLAACGDFDVAAFMDTASKGYESLNLMQRAWHIADALHAHLPRNYDQAIALMMSSLGPPLSATDSFGMSPFLYLPHTLYVARYGLAHFELSMLAQYELTQRFTAEFSIRPFIEKHPKQTLATLRAWALDDSPHVRRLVSEGTRPRLPWAARLREFQKDPSPVLDLLELLKDDPERYVRRSVANNLNDIGKDHPDLLVKTARRWLDNADANRKWIIHHALRSAVKRGDTDALSLLGYGEKSQVAICHSDITPRTARIGGQIHIHFELINETPLAQELLVDFRIHYVKANGASTPKVFKLRKLTLNGNETATFSKHISLQQMTTRKHYPGLHRVDILINGAPYPLGEFELSAAP